MVPAPVFLLRDTAVSVVTEPGLPLASWACTTTGKALPDTTLAPELTEVMASWVAEGSPTAKSLKEVIPVAWVLVAVLVPLVVVFHAAPSHRLTMKLAVFAPASRSPAAKLNVAL